MSISMPPNEVLETMSREDVARIQRVVEPVNDLWRKRFESIGNEISLRKWCIEHATASMPPDEVLRFLTAPIADILASPSQE
jgi:hypothetical protein